MVAYFALSATMCVTARQTVYMAAAACSATNVDSSNTVVPQFGYPETLGQITVPNLSNRVLLLVLLAIIHDIYESTVWDMYE